MDRIVYISCKATSLARDLAMIQERGYEVVKCVAVDQFVNTVHVETIALLQKSNRKPDTYVKLSLETEDGSAKIETTFDE